MTEIYKDKINQINLFFKNHAIKAECIEMKNYRNMIFYDIKIHAGTKIKQIQGCAQELALLLKSKNLPIIKLIPELGIVRIQIAQDLSDPIYFSNIFKKEEFPKKFSIPFLFGETDEGEKLWVDMSKNPHMIVAGSTGSGKSTFLHLLIENIKILNSEYGFDLNLFLADPKSVEFSKYKSNKDYPFVYKIVHDYDSCLKMLLNVQSLMNSRYKLFADLGITSVEELSNTYKKFFVIIDEVSYYMMYDKKNKMFENLLADLAQRCRAAGIYLILATQRPSVDVITGLIKANFPARLACKVSSKIDSNVIIDSFGAECLLGRGDAIFKNYNNDFTRLQIACAN